MNEKQDVGKFYSRIYLLFLFFFLALFQHLNVLLFQVKETDHVFQSSKCLKQRGENLEAIFFGGVAESSARFVSGEYSRELVFSMFSVFKFLMFIYAVQFVSLFKKYRKTNRSTNKGQRHNRGKRSQGFEPLRNFCPDDDINISLRQ